MVLRHRLCFIGFALPLLVMVQAAYGAPVPNAPKYVSGVLQGQDFDTILDMQESAGDGVVVLAGKRTEESLVPSTPAFDLKILRINSIGRVEAANALRGVQLLDQGCQFFECTSSQVEATQRLAATSRPLLAAHQGQILLVASDKETQNNYLLQLEQGSLVEQGRLPVADFGLYNVSLLKKLQVGDEELVLLGGQKAAGKNSISLVALDKDLKIKWSWDDTGEDREYLDNAFTVDAAAGRSEKIVVTSMVKYTSVYRFKISSFSVDGQLQSQYASDRSINSLVSFKSQYSHKRKRFYLAYNQITGSESNITGRVHATDGQGRIIWDQTKASKYSETSENGFVVNDLLILANESSERLMVIGNGIYNTCKDTFSLVQKRESLLVELNMANGQEVEKRYNMRLASEDVLNAALVSKGRFVGLGTTKSQLPDDQQAVLKPWFFSIDTKDLPQLVETGVYPKHAYKIGVTFGAYRPDIPAVVYSNTKYGGVEIQSITPGYPAALAGLEAGRHRFFARSVDQVLNQIADSKGRSIEFTMVTDEVSSHGIMYTKMHKKTIKPIRVCEL